MSPIYEADVGRMIPSVSTLDLEGRKYLPIIIEMSLKLTRDGEINTNMRVGPREGTLAREHGVAPTKQYGT